MNKHFVISQSDLMTYLFLVVLSIQYSFVNTELEIEGIISTIAVLIECAIFISYLSIRKFNKKTLFVIFLLLLTSMITYYKTGYTSFMVILMAAIIFEKIDYSKAFQLIFYIRLIMLLIVICCALLGIINIFETSVSKASLGAIVGYGLGYTHPNRLATAFEYLVMIYICYKNDKLRISNLILVAFFTLAFYYITKTRTLIFSVGAIIALIQLLRTSYTKKITTWILDRISLIIVPICTAISIVVPILMLTVSGKLQTFLYTLNGMFSSRFTHIYRAFLNYPVTLFGGIDDFSMLQEVYGYSSVDNGYIRLLYQFGIIGLIIFVVFSLITVKKLLKQRNYIYLIVFVVFCLTGLSENIFTSFAYNVVVPFWSELIRGIDENKLRGKTHGEK